MEFPSAREEGRGAMTLGHIARVLRLSDEQGRLSLTNTGMLIILFKIALVAQTTVPDLGALFLSLAAYNGKKLIEHAKSRASADDATSEHVEKLAVVAKTVDALAERAARTDTIGAVNSLLRKS